MSDTTVRTRPADTLLAWLHMTPVSGANRLAMTPQDLALLQACIPIARRLVVFCDPFCSADADDDVDALKAQYDDIDRADIFYMLGIAIGLELAAALDGVR
jgi:hypothetical protein